MSTTKHASGAALLAILLGSAAPAFANGLSDNQVVRGGNGAIAHSIEHGTCVRTRWEAGTDACAPRVAQQPAPVAPQPYVRTVLSSQDKVVYFDFNSYSLREDSRQRLNDVAQTLRTARDVRSAKIVGYTDRKGTMSYNQRLSQLRAESVKDYLAQQGYLNTSITQVQGLGKSDPVTSCERSLPREQEIACLAPDRRVEIEIEYLDTHVVR